MTACACLPMYDWPETRAEIGAFWSDLRRAVGEGLPAGLTAAPDEAALLALWRNPALVFGQCCWGPLELGLCPELTVLAQPDYSDVAGGRGPFYRSVLVARKGQAMPLPAHHGAALPAGGLAGQRLAYNARHSRSGWRALAQDLDEDPAEQAQSLLETGGHRATVRALIDGRADIAAIDARSWAMALAHEPGAAGLVVVGWTAERLGLPYVCHRQTPPALQARLKKALEALGAHRPRPEPEWPEPQKEAQ